MKRTITLILVMTLLLSVFVYGDMDQIRRQGYVEGYLLQNIGDILEIESYEGEFYYLPLTSDVLYTIDGYIVDKSNFMPGIEIYVGLSGTTVTSVEGYSTSNLGYIPEGSKMVTGRVVRIDHNQLVLKLATGKEETFFYMPYTIVLRNGQSTNINTLYEGDKVKLYFDEYDTKIASRISVEGNSILVKGLYKGRLASADKHSDKITVSNLYQLNNGDWKQYTGSFIPKPNFGYNQQLAYNMTLPYNSSSPLYIGGYPIPYSNLKYYGGKTVYLTIKDFFGKDRIEKMVVQNQYETTYSDKIKDVNWFTEELELNNNKNIAFNDGTVVIKNNRIVDSFALTAGSNVFVVADGRGADSIADIIYILDEDINNSKLGQHYIYAGRMDKIVEDRLWLKDFFLLDENQWQSFRGDKELYFDKDTYIYDLNEDRKISLEEFYSKSYAVDEDSKYTNDYGLRDWHSYIYTDGDRISAMVIKENMDSLLRQRITSGIIAPMDAENLVSNEPLQEEDQGQEQGEATQTNDKPIKDDPFVGWTARITNARDWSNIHSKWMEKKYDIYVNLDETLLIKNNKVIRPEDLKPNDSIYLIRDDYYGKILIVK